MSKRALTQSLSPPPAKHRKLSEHKLSYASVPANKVATFQKPIPLITFSYDASHKLHFDDRALRYYHPPPARDANLNYGYERWIRRPDEKGRLDNLLRALVEAKVEFNGKDVGVVGWRGVLTR
jgi:RAT1-interacting protein